MTLPELPGPVPQPIEQFSPTLANELLACPRRVGFARDPSFATWRRPSTFSVLGDAAHAVAELVAKRRRWPIERDELRRELGSFWNDRVARGAAKLAAAWAPAKPPPIEEWPTYHVTRSRTIRRAERAIGERGVGASAEVVARVDAANVAAGTEVALADPTSGLEGRADRIERVDGSYRVVDLKTGLNQYEPREGQLRQLLLYALLVQRATGEWPANIAIENASGEQFTVPLEPADAEAALSRALIAVDSFNDRRERGPDGLEARANAETCRWCAYRPCCAAYWRDLRVDWGHASVLGAIVRAGIDGKGAHADVDVISPTDLGASGTHIVGLSASPPAESTWLAAVDLRPIREPSSLSARWSSRIVTW